MVEVIITYQWKKNKDWRKFKVYEAQIVCDVIVFYKYKLFVNWIASINNYSEFFFWKKEEDKIQASEFWSN